LLFDCSSSSLTSSFRFLFLSCSRPHRALHSFPTRRSSDLPNRFRPLRFMNGRSFEHYRTGALSELMVVAKSLEFALESAKKNNRSEEHTSELQSRFDLVCRLLLEKKKKTQSKSNTVSKQGS